MKRLLQALFVLLILFIAVLFFNLYSFKSKQPEVEPIAQIEISDQTIKNFAKAITIRTISPENPADFDSAQFIAFNTFLRETYPLTDSLLEHKLFNRFSHLYKWPGSDESLKPIVLMGHLDVVPVIDENLADWQVSPFGGEIKDGFLWGRGTIDDKATVIGTFEAIERLLVEGYRPERTIYLAVGHDEEIGGLNGAVPIAKYLEEQGVEAEFVIDEGGTLSSGMVPGVEKDVALIGIAEKGFVSLYLSVKIEGGHSSMPAKETAIDVMSNAIARLKANPFPQEITPGLQEFINYLGPEMPFMNKIAMANSALLKPLILKAYESTPSGNAMTRTTTSPTIFRSGVKDNIIPQSATATVNFRILPGSTIDDVISRVRTVIDDDRVEISQGEFNSQASNVSSTQATGFKVLQKTILENYPEVIVAPYLVVGATDSRHYANISENIYRFAPIKITPETSKSFHGLNERIGIHEIKRGVQFYMQLIRNSASNQ